MEECVDKISAYLTDNAEKLYDTTVLQLRHDVGFSHSSGMLLIVEEIGTISLTIIWGKMTLSGCYSSQ